MDQRLGNIEQLIKSLSDSHEEFRKSQQIDYVRSHDRNLRDACQTIQW